MDALDNQDLALAELHGCPLIGRTTETTDKIEARRRHSAPLHELGQMLVEEIEIDGFERFKVRFAVVIEGRVLEIDVVVVQRKGDRFETVDPELYAEPFGKGRLPG